MSISALNVRAALLRWLEQISRFLLSWGAKVVGNIASFIAQAVVAFFTSFFLFRDSKLMLARTAAVLPLQADHGTTTLQWHQQLNYCECLRMRCGWYCARISYWFGFLGAWSEFTGAVGIGDAASVTYSNCRLGSGVGTGGDHLASGRALVEGRDLAWLGSGRCRASRQFTEAVRGQRTRQAAYLVGVLRFARGRESIRNYGALYWACSAFCNSGPARDVAGGESSEN